MSRARCFCRSILPFSHLVTYISCECCVSVPTLTLWGSRSCTCGLWTVQAGDVTGVALFSFTSLGFFSKGIMGELFRVLQRCLSWDRDSARLLSYTGIEVEDFWSIPHWSIHNPSCKRRPQSGGIKSDAPLLSAQTKFLINYICGCKVFLRHVWLLWSSQLLIDKWKSHSSQARGEYWGVDHLRPAEEMFFTSL